MVDPVKDRHKMIRTFRSVVQSHVQSAWVFLKPFDVCALEHSGQAPKMWIKMVSVYTAPATVGGLRGATWEYWIFMDPEKHATTQNL